MIMRTNQSAVARKRGRGRFSKSPVRWAFLILTTVLGGVIVLGAMIMVLLKIGRQDLVTGPSEPEKPGGFIMVEEKPVETAPAPPKPALQEKKLTFYETLSGPMEGTSAVRFEAPESGPTATDDQEEIPPAAGRDRAHYTLQVGSFVEEELARKLVEGLRRKGYPAYMVPVELDEKDRRYRVRVGRFSSKDSARRLAHRLSDAEGLQSFIAYTDRQD